MQISVRFWLKGIFIDAVTTQEEAVTTQEEVSSTSQNSVPDFSVETLTAEEQDLYVSQNNVLDSQMEENAHTLPCNCQQVSDRYQRCICDSGEEFRCLLIGTTIRPSLRKRDAEEASAGHEEVHTDDTDFIETASSISITESSTLPSVDDMSSSLISATSSLNDAAAADNDIAHSSVELLYMNCRCNCSTPAKSTTFCDCTDARSDERPCPSFTCSMVQALYVSTTGRVVDSKERSK